MRKFCFKPEEDEPSQEKDYSLFLFVLHNCKKGNN